MAQPRFQHLVARDPSISSYIRPPQEIDMNQHSDRGNAALYEFVEPTVSMFLPGSQP